MTHSGGLALALLLLATAHACAPAAPSEPETPVPPGPLEPEHQGEFVPPGDEAPAPPAKSALVDGGAPR
jgi:hypothetical protein